VKSSYVVIMFLFGGKRETCTHAIIIMLHNQFPLDGRDDRIQTKTDSHSLGIMRMFSSYLK